MRGVDAVTNIAAMQHVPIRRDAPVDKHPRRPMNLDRGLPRPVHLAVAISIPSRCPQPTRGRALHMGPEALKKAIVKANRPRQGKGHYSPRILLIRLT
jgi:hypothetical protein